MWQVTVALLTHDHVTLIKNLWQISPLKINCEPKLKQMNGQSKVKEKERPDTVLVFGCENKRDKNMSSTQLELNLKLCSSLPPNPTKKEKGCY